MAQAYFYSNTAVDDTLGNAAGISNSATSMFINGTPTGYPNQYPFKLVLDQGLATEEIVKVTAGSGTSGVPWTIVRAWDGTTAQAHSNGAAVGHRITAEDETLSRLHEAMVTSGTGVHGLPASAWVTAAIAALDENTLANSTTTAITWSSIPATYNHLLIIVNGKFTETTAQADDIAVTLNGDSTAKYSSVTQYATNVSGASTGALFGGQTTQAGVTSWPMLRMAASQSGGAANAGGGWAIIPNYASTTWNKCFVSQSGAGYGTGAFVDMRLRSGWYNPSVQAAISSITLTAPGSLFFTTGTFLGLYGIALWTMGLWSYWSTSRTGRAWSARWVRTSSSPAKHAGLPGRSTRQRKRSVRQHWRGCASERSTMTR